MIVEVERRERERKREEKYRKMEDMVGDGGLSVGGGIASNGSTVVALPIVPVDSGEMGGHHEDEGEKEREREEEKRKGNKRVAKARWLSLTSWGHW